MKNDNPPYTYVLQVQKDGENWEDVELFWDLLLAVATLDMYSLLRDENTYRLMPIEKE